MAAIPTTTPATISAATLTDWLIDARRRTLDLVEDLTDAQLSVPLLAIINPILWEIGHVAWFHENWVLRHHEKRPPLRPDGDALYDSAAIKHDTRWDLPLPDRAATLRYMSQVQTQILDLLHAGTPSDSLIYFVLLGIFHEDMHAEASMYTRQTLGYSRPRLTPAAEKNGTHAPTQTGPCPGDVTIPGGTFHLGAEPDELFVFDNEKWAHPVELRPFAIARAPITQAEFAAFVDENGYRRREFWSEAGWRWRSEADADHPVYWQRQVPGNWLRRDFDQWLPLEPHRPVLHVNWFEAETYCNWAGRRLPTEAEWEVAASGLAKQRFPWGNEAPSAGHANLDGFALACSDVGDYSAGDSPYGCRQMIGNVWEWTASDFQPYPGFVIDPYKDYSQPFFGIAKVLRGGCWVTRGRLLRNTWRNYYRPVRRDIWAGFRTCARDGGGK